MDQEDGEDSVDAVVVAVEEDAAAGAAVDAEEVVDEAGERPEAAGVSAILLGAMDPRPTRKSLSISCN